MLNTIQNSKELIFDVFCMYVLCSTVYNIIKTFRECGEISVHKAKNQYCILVIFVPSGCTALKTGMILSWRSLHGLSNTSCFQIAVNTIHRSIHKCRLFCSIKQRRGRMWTQYRNAAFFRLKLSENGKVENSSLVREIRMFFVFWKTWKPHPQD